MIETYLESVDEKFKDSFQQLLQTIQENIPSGFELVMQYNMPTFVVPLSVYPAGYLCRVDEPLPFISVAATKKHLAIYHMGLYAKSGEEVLTWFREEYAKQVSTKLNMGKSCIRLTNPKNIPYALIGQLSRKISLTEWIESYDDYAQKRKR